MDQKKLIKMGRLSKDTWNKLADEDAEFYILTNKGKEGGRWNSNEFLETGKEEWGGFKEFLAHHGLENTISKNKTALDMGCGVGRIAFAIAQDFSKVFGIDASDIMIEKAKKYQKQLNIKNLEFLVNNGIDLSLISDGSIDFVFSHLTLQHCPSSKQILAYIKEFSRILKPSGVCLFQVKVAPTFFSYFRFMLSERLAKIRHFFKKDYYATKGAFFGSWIYYPHIYKIISQNFSSYQLIQAPVEIYKDRFNDKFSIVAKQKRSFWICIK